MTGFLVMEEAFILHDTNLVFWLGLLLFKEEFGIWKLENVLKTQELFRLPNKSYGSIDFTLN